LPACNHKSEASPTAGIEATRFTALRKLPASELAKKLAAAQLAKEFLFRIRGASSGAPQKLALRQGPLDKKQPLSAVKPGQA